MFDKELLISPVRWALEKSGLKKNG